jgi:hypothetical protein
MTKSPSSGPPASGPLEFFHPSAPLGNGEPSPFARRAEPAPPVVRKVDPVIREAQKALRVLEVLPEVLAARAALRK